MEQIDADTGNLIEKLDKWLDGLFRLLPNIVLAIVVAAVAIAIAIYVSSYLRKRAIKNDRPSLGDVMGALTKWAIILLGGMLAVSIVAPSVKPADILAGLGVGSVAIGFAFKDILQNMLAGILILLRQPFEIGDEIVSGGHEGVVEKIETRATFLKTYDGRRVVVPNSEIYTNSVIVKTAFQHIRSQYDIGIGCNDNWDDAKRLMLEACAASEGVLEDPAPDVIPVDMADSSNVIRLRWWTKSKRGSVIHTFGRVIESTYRKLDEHGIDLPYPTQVVLFHDQTEQTDGDRRTQREGWPAGKVDVPETRKISDAIAGQHQ